MEMVKRLVRQKKTFPHVVSTPREVGESHHHEFGSWSVSLLHASTTTNHAARVLYRVYEWTAESCSHSYAVMRISLRSGILTRQGNRAMTENLALAASITILVAISGQAFAR